MPRLLLCTLALLLAAGSTTPLPVDPNSVRLLSILLEQRSAGVAHPVDPRHVFNSGDTIRFRLRPQVDAYLYVLDLSTSGRYDVLFPRPETGNDNRIEHGRDYLLPATRDGWFKVAGPPGHERLYFVLSPAPLAPTQQQQQNLLPLPPQGTPPPTMTPRCNDGIFRARGECIDTDAGPRTVEPGDPLPGNISRLAPGASRDLVFTPSAHASVVASSAPLSGPVVYQFLLAHN